VDWPPVICASPSSVMVFANVYDEPLFERMMISDPVPIVMGPLPIAPSASVPNILRLDPVPSVNPPEYAGGVVSASAARPALITAESVPDGTGPAPEFQLAELFQSSSLPPGPGLAVLVMVCVAACAPTASRPIAATIITTVRMFLVVFIPILLKNVPFLLLMYPPRAQAARPSRAIVAGSGTSPSGPAESVETPAVPSRFRKRSPLPRSTTSPAAPPRPESCVQVRLPIWASANVPSKTWNN